MKARIIAWIASAIFIGASAAMLTSCAAIQPTAHVDATGYEVGVRGTWDGVAVGVRSLFAKTGDEPVDSGK